MGFNSAFKGLKAVLCINSCHSVFCITDAVLKFWFWDWYPHIGIPFLFTLPWPCLPVKPTVECSTSFTSFYQPYVVPPPQYFSDLYNNCSSDFRVLYCSAKIQDITRYQSEVLACLEWNLLSFGLDFFFHTAFLCERASYGSTRSLCFSISCAGVVKMICSD